MTNPEVHVNKGPSGSAAAAAAAEAAAAAHPVSIDHNTSSGAKEKLAVDGARNKQITKPPSGMKPLIPGKKHQGMANAETDAARKMKADEKSKRLALLRKEEADSFSGGFSEREGNQAYQLPTSALSKLAQGLSFNEGDQGLITPTTSSEELINLVQKELAVGQKVDASWVDKAFEFLLEVIKTYIDKTSGLQSNYLEKLYENVAKAKVIFYDRYAVEIQTAEALKEPANVLLSQDASFPDVMDHLREMVNNPQGAHEKFEYYTKTRGKKYSSIRSEFDLLYRYMGGMVKKKLENPHLRQLLEEIKVLQSIVGVFLQSKREFKSFYTYLDKVIGLFDE